MRPFLNFSLTNIQKYDMLYISNCKGEYNMSVHELNREQMICLKQSILCNRDITTDWLSLAQADNIIMVLCLQRMIFIETKRYTTNKAY